MIKQQQIKRDSPSS